MKLKLNFKFKVNQARIICRQLTGLTQAPAVILMELKITSEIEGKVKLRKRLDFQEWVIPWSYVDNFPTENVF